MTHKTSESNSQANDRMQWFRQARFGMFIHWGLYSIPAGQWEGRDDYGEWIMEVAKIPSSRYEKFAREFNPVKFDAREWVSLAKRAGMKYLVITSKHHDGFCMFDTRLTDYNITNTPFARDPMTELADACRQQGLVFCFYYSIMDWHHPAYAPRRPWNDTARGQPDMDRYVEFTKGQLRELLSNYGDIGILWFDGNWEETWTIERGRDLYNYVRSISPSVIVNDRVGKTTGLHHGDRAQSIGDYITPEQEVPATGLPGIDWESCMTMNDHWGYNRCDNNWKSSEQLIQLLTDISGKGGNFLLNVGPTAEGTIPQPSVQRLREIGNWMKTSGRTLPQTAD